MTSLEYITNKHNRCVVCDGREVLSVKDEQVKESSLSKGLDGRLYCRDKKECQRNQEAERTMVDFEINETGKIKTKKISSPIGDVLEIKDGKI